MPSSIWCADCLKHIVLCVDIYISIYIYLESLHRLLFGTISLGQFPGLAKVICYKGLEKSSITVKLIKTNNPQKIFSTKIHLLPVMMLQMLIVRYHVF